MEKILRNKESYKSVLDYAVSLIKQTCSGEIAIIIQNSKFIQLERNERITLCENTMNCVPMPSSDMLKKQLLEAINNLEFGRIVIVIKKHQVVRIERTEQKLIKNK